MKFNKIFVLIGLLSIISISFGFTANRTEWKVAPQLNLRPKTSMKLLIKDDQTVAIDDALKGSTKVKKSLEHENATKAKNHSYGKRYDDIKNNSNDQTNFMVKLLTESKDKENGYEQIAIASMKEKSSNGPLNVILMLIDGLERNYKSLPINLEDFHYHGLLESCPENFESIRYIKTKEGCDCRDSLKANILSFLTWAHHIKEKSINTLYEMPWVYINRINVDTHSFMKPQGIDREFQTSGQSNDPKASKESKLSDSPLEFYGQPNMNHNDGWWHVSDILTRLRESFFRTLLSSLSREAESSLSQQNAYRHRDRSFLRRSNYRELADRTLEEFISITNQQNYVLLATAGSDELTDVLELLQLYISPSNTLLVVMSTCPRDGFSPAPIFVRGPGVDRLATVKSLYQVPGAIRDVVNEIECRNSDIGCDEMETNPEKFIRDDLPERKRQEKFKRSEASSNVNTSNIKSRTIKEAIVFEITASTTQVSASVKNSPDIIFYIFVILNTIFVTSTTKY